ncbi:MAG: hypothetical protein CMM52_05590 [Rhodospirillaceae bacterium]|nr:hypothetical protein [Rhodospirillaceae bacterium]|tara:strand:+ start:11825 stop:12010 length:186 start_codon:yes stop_codon:yes gene_type:complete
MAGNDSDIDVFLKAWKDFDIQFRYGNLQLLAVQRPKSKKATKTGRLSTADGRHLIIESFRI